MDGNDKVLTLGVVADVKPEVDETLVDLLEDMLREVKEGKIKSIAGVVLDNDGDNLEFTSVEPVDELKMYGALHVLCTVYAQEHLTEWVDM